MDGLSPSTLVAVAVGWILSEVSQRLRVRRARQVALGRALSELLEIRHYVKATQLMISEIHARWPLTSDNLRMLMQQVSILMPPDADLPKRYSEAVTAIAGHRPVTAFKLRAKDQLPTVLLRLQSEEFLTRVPADGWQQLDSLLREAGLETIDENLTEVALSHGIGTWWRVRRILRRSTELPAEVRTFLDRNMSPPEGESRGDDDSAA